MVVSMEIQPCSSSTGRNAAAKLTRVSRITDACECGRCPCKRKVTGDKGERQREREGVTC